MGFYPGEVVLPNDAEELLARASKDVQVRPSFHTAESDNKKSC